MFDTLAIPNRAWFSLTGMCNNNCDWCYRNGSETKDYLDVDFAIMAAEIFAKCGIRNCSIVGGEPTLHKDCRNLINYFLDKNLFLSCILITNGSSDHSLLDDKWSSNSKIHVTVSLHGADEKHYFENTGNGVGFLRAVDFIKALRLQKINCSVNVVISKENLDRMFDFIDIVSSLEVSTLCFTIGISSIDDDSYSTDPYKIANSIKKINEKCHIKNQKHCFVFSLPWCILEEDFLEILLRNEELVFNCPVHKGKVVVLKENGTLALCTHLSSIEISNKEQTKHILSDKDTFINFWNSEELKQVRSSVDVHRHNKCLKCKYRHYCKGGCPLWWKFFDFKEIFCEK